MGVRLTINKSKCPKKDLMLMSGREQLDLKPKVNGCKEQHMLFYQVFFIVQK